MEKSLIFCNLWLYLDFVRKNENNLLWIGEKMTKPFDCITNDRQKLIVQQPINLDLKY